MKEYSRQFIDRLAYASLAVAVIIAAVSLTVIPTKAPAHPYAIGIAMTFFILGVALILQMRVSKRKLNIGLIISVAIFVASTATLYASNFSPIVGDIMLISCVSVCVFSVSSTHLESESTRFQKTKFYKIGRGILWLAALSVLIFVGIFKREFFSADYLWVALAVAVAATIAHKAIMRSGAPKNN